MTYQSVKPSRATRDKNRRAASPNPDAITSDLTRRLQRKAWRRERRQRLGYGYTTDRYGMDDQPDT